MEKKKDLNSYMTVGEVAKKMGISVRTLQYYDKEGFFSPSNIGEGNRRLYTDKDLVELHQILSLKNLGFSLEDIKNKVIPLDNPAEVIQALNNQANVIRAKIQSLTESYNEIEILKQEVIQMKTVNFKKYADIIVNIQLKNDNYWMIKYFDEETLNRLRNHFTDNNMAIEFMKEYQLINNTALKLHKKNVPHDSKEAQKLSKKFWEMILNITKGDMTMISNFMKVKDESEYESKNESDQVLALSYIEKAIEIYFTNLGYDPFNGESV